MHIRPNLLKVHVVDEELHNILSSLLRILLSSQEHTERFKIIFIQ